jgi:hypothetical protein
LCSQSWICLMTANLKKRKIEKISRSTIWPRMICAAKARATHSKPLRSSTKPTYNSSIRKMWNEVLSVSIIGRAYVRNLRAGRVFRDWPDSVGKRALALHTFCPFRKKKIICTLTLVALGTLIWFGENLLAFLGKWLIL